MTRRSAKIHQIITREKDYYHVLCRVLEAAVDAPQTKRPSARTAMAMAKAKTYQDAADAPATLRAYASDLKNYEAWCARHGMTALPAMPEVVGAYLAASGEGYAMQTLRRRVAAIARVDDVAVERLG